MKKTKSKTYNRYANGTGLTGVAQYAGMIPQVADGLISIFENDPNAYSRQPIMNASTIRGMATPYSQFALGGNVLLEGDPIKGDPTKPSRKVQRELRKKNLRSNFGFNGIVADNGSFVDNPSELDAMHTNIEFMKHNNPESNIYRLKDQHQVVNPDILNILNPTPQLLNTNPLLQKRGLPMAAYGGEIDGAGQLEELQRMADEAGISIEELLAQMQGGGDEEDTSYGEADLEAEGQGDLEPLDGEEPDSEDDEIGETFAYGGRARGKVPIEVEGKEVLKTPTGRLHKATGPKHGDGGIKVNVPPGTKIYSNRVKVDGKTMAEREVKRSKAIERLEKLKLKNPHDTLLQSSLQRTGEVNQAQEADDMALQEDMNMKQSRNKFPLGTNWRGVPYINNDPQLPFDPLAGTGLSDIPLQNNQQVPYHEGYMAGANPITSNSLRAPSAVDIHGLPTGVGVRSASQPAPIVENPVDQGLTTGDYVGMAGNLFGAIAPIINTRNAAAATNPTINRYKGFGHEAIDANDAAQNMASTMQDNALTDIETGDATARSRNRNSAQSVNTLRALDAVTDMNTNRAKTSARDAFTRQSIGLLGQRGQFTNMRDRVEMSGQERADIENEAKTDNYFSNNAANLANVANQVQSFGRNLNTSNQNQVDANLIASMAKNPITIDRNGKIVNKNMNPEQVQRYLDLGYTIEDGKLVAPRKH